MKKLKFFAVLLVVLVVALLILEKEDAPKKIFHQENQDVLVGSIYDPSAKIFPDKDFSANFHKAERVSKRMRFVIDEKSSRIYFSDQRNHRIYVFNEKGVLINEFGQKGNEPGYLFRPYVMGVFSGKLFARNSCEPTTGSRISMFESNDCRYFGEIKTEKKALLFFVPYPYNETILYKTHYYFGRESQERKISVNLFTKEKDIELASFLRKFVVFSTSEDSPFSFISENYYFSGKFIFVANQEFALFSVSNESFIHLFYPEWKEPRKFDIFSGLPRVKVEDEMVEKSIQAVCKEIDENLLKKGKLMSKQERKKREEWSRYARGDAKRKIWENKGDFVPYYERVLIDADGKILFISNTLKRAYIFRLDKEEIMLERIATISSPHPLLDLIISGEWIYLGKNYILGYWRDKEGNWVFNKYLIKY